MHADALADGAASVHNDTEPAGDGRDRQALRDLVERCGGSVVGCAFVVELAFLRGRARPDGFDVHTLMVDEAE